MKLIIAPDIDLRKQETALFRTFQKVGIDTYVPDLYYRTTSTEAPEGLSKSKAKPCLFTLSQSEEELAQIHNCYLRSECRSRLTFQDFLAVTCTKKVEGILVTDDIVLCRYAQQQSVQTMTLHEAIAECERLRRQGEQRRENLRHYYDKGKPAMGRKAVAQKSSRSYDKD